MTSPYPPLWIQSSYARLLVDMHITDHDPEFMTRFDPEAFVNCAVEAGVDSVMVYACCHNGNCNYPSQVGTQHPGLAGRDVFGETVALLRARGIRPIAYSTVVYHNRAAQEHPAWRIVFPNGKQNMRRYWLCCPNNLEYREFAKAQTAEIIQYDVDGIFIDMTFWPGICLCTSCRERYRAETGGAEIPETVNWDDTTWYGFQLARERWMDEFALELKREVKRHKPITVTNQFSPICADWSFGVTGGVARECEYVSGDFHGGHYHQLLGTKVMSHYSANIPFEFMTPLNETLFDHSSPKGHDQLLREAANTLASGGAYFFIHDLEPDGRLNAVYYPRLGRITETLRPFTERVRELRPKLVADVGLYFDPECKVDPLINGSTIRELCNTETNQEVRPNPYLDELKGAARLLSRQHIPYVVRAPEALELGGLRSLVVNNARYLSTAAAERIREFVRQGGTLLATGETSLFDELGNKRADFALADVFGVKYTGRQTGAQHALRDLGTGVTLSHYRHGSPASRPAPLVEPAGAEVLAEVLVPRFDPADPVRWASIHCTPCTEPTGIVAVSVHQFGQGKCIYIYSDALAIQLDGQEDYFGPLLQTRLAHGTVLETNAPVCVEVTLQQSSTQPDHWLLSLLNYQENQPNLPVHELSVRFRLPDGLVPQRVRQVSSGQELPFTLAGTEISLTVARLETLEMLELQVADSTATYFETLP